MNKVFGNISDFAPVKEDATRVIISYGYEEVGDGENATWIEIYFDKTVVAMPTFAQAKEAIINAINAITDERILKGFVWNNKPVYLSTENQFNYKAAYDVAVQTEGQTLPVKFKLGEDEEGQPVYHTFNSLSSFTDFYTRAIAYINQCLNDGWDEKDNFDWTPYEEALGAEQNVNTEE